MVSFPCAPLAPFLQLFHPIQLVSVSPLNILGLIMFSFSLSSLLLSPLDLVAAELCLDLVLLVPLPHRNVLFAHNHNKWTDKNMSTRGQLKK